MPLFCSRSAQNSFLVLMCHKTHIIHSLIFSRSGFFWWRWVGFRCRGVLLILIVVGQGPTVFAVGAGGVVRTILSLLSFLFLSPALWEAARYRLKHCLKGPLSPKQPTNQFFSGSQIDWIRNFLFIFWDNTPWKNLNFWGGNAAISLTGNSLSQELWYNCKHSQIMLNPIFCKSFRQIRAPWAVALTKQLEKD